MMIGSSLPGAAPSGNRLLTNGVDVKPATYVPSKERIEMMVRGMDSMDSSDQVESRRKSLDLQMRDYQEHENHLAGLLSDLSPSETEEVATLQRELLSVQSQKADAQENCSGWLEFVKGQEKRVESHTKFLSKFTGLSVDELKSRTGWQP